MLSCSLAIEESKALPSYVACSEATSLVRGETRILCARLLASAVLKGVEGLEMVVRECVVWLVASREDPDPLQQWLQFPFLVLEMTVQRLKNLSPGRHSRG